MNRHRPTDGCWKKAIADSISTGRSAVSDGCKCCQRPICNSSSSAVQHNHLPHHLLTAYSLGASPSHLQSIFDANVPSMAPLERSKADGGEEVLKSPPLVHQGNWWDTKMLGDKK